MPPKKTDRPAPSQPPPATLEVVHPLWLLKAMGLVIVAALVCGYITLCLLFYQGQWQLILHPTRTTQPLTGLGGMTADAVHFDAAETGMPRLSGLWIPAPAITRYPRLTVLYLRSGDASLAQSPVDARNLRILHDLGLSVFAFDYRGYGQSDPTRPNQARMTEDAAHALQYLNESRHIPDSGIVLYGSGLGASLAMGLAVAHADIPALILDSPGPAPVATALADPRVSALPVRLLFHEEFPLAPLADLKTPKLLISHPDAKTPMRTEFRGAADPKTTVELPPDDAAALPASIARFLDQIGDQIAH
jgi:pimeloyl-ACP methyl ester carboxylesterase